MSGRLLLLASLALVSGFAPAPLPRASRHGPQRNDLAKLQGEWDLLELHRRGHLMMRPSTRVTIARDELSISTGRRAQARYRVRINSATSPPSLDLIANGLDEEPALAIYRLDGDRLTICSDPSERPTTFDVKQRGRVMVLRRR
jgi:uncharacterized protein (TIGR03067 family)